MAHTTARLKIKNTGLREQVNEHYLPGAVTNYERKNYRKNYIKLHKIPLKFEKDFIRRRVQLIIRRAKHRSAAKK